ncbi:hypothetical protein BDL97_15G010700 [Sphagnum fallax]|nr:hypothetical protein BDL97_15G010700 [Sphagnum fallax]KAH8938951.1 hypothetical protein BDL97_15G010700 [Sphagnum fallax]KAH8938952.1 hypothetical protein BDL97_15G010700 [Sphagnum fallax]KAH8938953.1 hypothetical protein BDL97_15G010700 [Sphagnum fallax]
MEVQLITTSVIPSSAVLVTASLRTRKLDLYVKPLGLPRFGIIMKSSIQVPSSRGRRRRRQGLGFGGLQSVVTCAEKEDEEKELLEPAPRIDASQTPSWQRASMSSKIFMAALVWISLFFGICIMDNDVGGGRKGKRGPRI